MTYLRQFYSPSEEECFQSYIAKNDEDIRLWAETPKWRFIRRAYLYSRYQASARMIQYAREAYDANARDWLLAGRPERPGDRMRSMLDDALASMRGEL